MKTKLNLISLLFFVIIIIVPSFPQDDVRMEEALIHFNNAEYNEALKIFLELDKKNYKYSESIKNKIAFCYRNLGDKKEAIKWFKAALKEKDLIDPIKASINMSLGFLYIDTGQKKLAKQHFREADKLGILYPIEYKYEDEGWFYIGHAEREAVYYNPKSLKKIKSGIYRVWTKWLWDENSLDDDDFKGTIRTVENVENRKNEILKEREGVYYSIYLSEYNCIQSQTRVLSVTDYDKKGNVIKTLNYNNENSNQEWDYIVPGSIGEQIINKICK